MAEKSFGVKEINLIGASGTPTIESPNNLNLNAVNVAISTNATIGGNLTVTGTVGIAGTLTYEDVTNVVAIGIVTAREGVFIPDNKKLELGNAAGSGDLELFHDGTDSIIRDTTGILRIRSNDLKLEDGSTNDYIECNSGADVILYYNNSAKLATTNTGISVTGQGVFSSAITASTYIQGTSSNGGLKFYSDSSASKGVVLNTDDHLVPSNDSASDLGLTGTRWRNLYADTLYGDGSNLTNLPSDTPADTDVQITFDISASGSSGYIFTGPGNDGSTVNPDIYLVRGQRYRFINTTGSSHPFEFRNAANNADYTDGITGSQSGTQDFNVQYDAPAQLKYRCTIHTGSMVGNIYITGQQLINGADNRIVTASGAYGLNGESTFTYDGSATVALANANPQIRLTDTNDSNKNFDMVISGGDGYLSANSSGMGLNFEVTGSTRLRIDSSGRVMIGNSQAANMLSAANNLIVGTGSGSEGMTIYSGSSDGGFIAFADGTSDPSYRMGQIIYDHSVNTMVFRINGNTDRLRIDSNGRLLVGTTVEGHSNADDLTIATSANTGITIRSGA